MNEYENQTKREGMFDEIVAEMQQLVEKHRKMPEHIIWNSCSDFLYNLLLRENDLKYLIEEAKKEE